MATMEERVSALESTLDDFAPPFKAVMVKLDEHSGLLKVVVAKLDEHSEVLKVMVTKLNEHSEVLREVVRDVRVQGGEIREWRMRQATLEMQVSSINLRQNILGEKIDDLRDEFRGDIRELRQDTNQKLDQIIALLAKGGKSDATVG